jgi:hypothetical protein
MQPFLWTLILYAVSPDTAVVCPEDFREALAPWIAHRQAQGYQPVLLSNEQSAAEIRADIRRLADAAPLRSIVLVGDVPAKSDDSDYDRNARRLSTPTHFVAARVKVSTGARNRRSLRTILTVTWTAMGCRRSRWVGCRCAAPNS